MNILHLPSEILTKIFGYVEDKCNFALTCKLFNEIVKKKRIIKLETLSYIKSFKNERAFHVIAINSKLIFINNNEDIKKFFVIGNDKKVIYTYSVRSLVEDPIICSNVVNDTIIILITYISTDYYDYNYGYKCEEYLYMLRDILREILKNHFCKYKYKIIIITGWNYRFRENLNDLIVEVYKNNGRNRHRILNVDMFYIPVYVNEECMFLRSGIKLYIYNYIKRNSKILRIYEKLPGSSIDESGITLDYTLLEGLGVSNIILNEFRSILRNCQWLYKCLVTNKYLIINYFELLGNSSYQRSVITVVNLHSRKKSTIFKCNGPYRYEEVLLLHCICNNDMYISYYSYGYDKHKLHSIKLK